MSKGLIIAIGLDRFIADFCINAVQPDYIVFLATEATLPLVSETLAVYKPVAHKICYIKDIYSTGETTQEFLNAFQWMKAQPNVSEINIDATNSITVVEMATYVSASLIDLYRDILEETVELKLIYVHTEWAPSETGSYVEVRGTEKLIELEKPVDSLSFVRAFEALRAFNCGRYEQAFEDFKKLGSVTSGDRSLMYRGFAYLSSAYECWDKMSFHDAHKYLLEAHGFLSKSTSFRVIPAILSSLQSNIEALVALLNEDPLEIILDLYTNAERREREGRLDDALARLYACLERIVQHRLHANKFDTKQPDYSVFPESIVNNYQKLMKGELPKELELKKGSMLLSCLDDAIGKLLQKIGPQTFTGLIGLRNSSILAHGIKPIGIEHFTNFKNKLFLPLWNQFLITTDRSEIHLNKHHHIIISNISDLVTKRSADAQQIFSINKASVLH